MEQSDFLIRSATTELFNSLAIERSEARECLFKLLVVTLEDAEGDLWFASLGTRLQACGYSPLVDKSSEYKLMSIVIRNAFDHSPRVWQHCLGIKSRRDATVKNVVIAMQYYLKSVVVAKQRYLENFRD